MMYARFRTLRACCVALTFAATLACSGELTAPETREATDTRFLHVARGFPPLVSTRMTFYAVKGKSASADVWFRAEAGARDSVKLLEFRVGAGSLDRRPDGSAIAVGDSVLITLTVTDPYHLVVDYQPSGLKFSSSDQPRLRMFWAACGDDLNYDGRVDALDTSLVGQLGIWRQEAPLLPWVRQSATTNAGARMIDAPLSGFSGYAIML